MSWLTGFAVIPWFPQFVMIFLSAVNTSPLSLLLLPLNSGCVPLCGWQIDGLTDWMAGGVCVCAFWHSPSHLESYLTLLAISRQLNEISHWTTAQPALHSADWKTENRMWRNETPNQKCRTVCCDLLGTLLRAWQVSRLQGWHMFTYRVLLLSVQLFWEEGDSLCAHSHKLLQPSSCIALTPPQFNHVQRFKSSDTLCVNAFQFLK